MNDLLVVDAEWNKSVTVGVDTVLQPGPEMLFCRSEGRFAPPPVMIAPRRLSIPTCKWKQIDRFFRSAKPKTVALLAEALARALGGVCGCDKT